MKNYWKCIIGPIDRDKLPWGADAILRMPVKRAYEEMCDKLDVDVEGYTCSSGWGVTEDQLSSLFYASCDDETKKQLIQSYYTEGKEMPRELRAWELLFNEERLDRVE